MAPKRKHCEPDRRLLEVSSPSPGAELQPLRGTSSLLVSPALNALTPQSTPAAILANEWNTYAPTFGLQLWNVNAQLPRHTLELVPLPPAFLQGILFRISMTWMAATRGALMRLRDLDGVSSSLCPASPYSAVINDQSMPFTVRRRRCLHVSRPYTGHF